MNKAWTVKQSVDRLTESVEALKGLQIPEQKLVPDKLLHRLDGLTDTIRTLVNFIVSMEYE